MSLDTLQERLAEIQSLNNIGAVLGWDQQTQMPEAAAGARAEHLATLGKVLHEKSTTDELGKLIEDAEKEIDGMDSDSFEVALVNMARYNFDQATKVPTEFVAEFQRATALAHNRWAQARAENDFSQFRDDLAKIFEMTQQQAEYLGYDDHPYDALLDQYERGMKSADVTRIFNDLRDQLVPIVAGIADNKDKASDALLRLDYPIELQRQFGNEVATKIGFDFDRGRQDLAVHPFCTNFSRNDVRITTRYEIDWFSGGLFSTIHEAGHGMYEQGSAEALDRTPLAGGTSLGVHESQSRLWENVVGRSRNFWTFFYPELQKAFPEQLSNASLDDFYRAINASSPSFIRVEADEVTYCLHIMIRYDLERAVYDGDVKIDDIPAAWNAKYEEYLGITPPNDTLGCLQDVHWSAGIMGYFPTYALGNLLSLQFYEKAIEAHPEIPEQFAEGKFDTLLTWLQDNIYQHGSKYPPKNLIKQVTGEEIRVEPFINYIKNKYGEIYGI